MTKWLLALAVFLSLIISGCVSTPETPAPAPVDATPAATSSVPLPTAIPPSPTTTSFVKPAISVTFYPASVNGDTNITFQWEVSGGSRGEISYTAIHWGYKKGGANITDYPRVSKVLTGKTPQMFSAEIKAPAGGDFFFRADAIVDGEHVYSPEYRIIIIASMGEGGGY